MKKALKIVGFIALGIIAIIGLGAGYVQMKGIPTYQVEAPELEVQGDSAMVAEGKRLATMVCNHCHMSKNQKLEGNFVEKGTFGEIYAPNITQHPEHGIGQYTDGELAYLLRTGVKKNGQYTPPYMPKFPHLSDRDLHSIIAFLRSDEPEVQPSETVQPAPKPSFLVKLLCNVAFKPLPYSEEMIQAPPMHDKVAYGKYLVTAKVECYSCHSASFTTVDVMNPENSEGYFGGGNIFHNPEDGTPIKSANITLHQETGIGNWTEEEFIQAVRFGRLPNGNMARWPMLPYSEMTEEEASAIWAYLQTIPAVENEVERNF